MGKEIKESARDIYSDMYEQEERDIEKAVRVLSKYSEDESYEQLTISPPEQVHCNICGGLMDFWDIQEDFTIHKCVGYGSVHDMEEIKLQICCSCFDKIVERCAINPVVGEWHYCNRL